MYSIFHKQKHKELKPVLVMVIAWAGVRVTYIFVWDTIQKSTWQSIPDS